MTLRGLGVGMGRYRWQRWQGRYRLRLLSSYPMKQAGQWAGLLGIPKDGEDDTVDSLKTDIRDARGRVALLEVGDWVTQVGAMLALIPRGSGLSRHKAW